MNETTNQAPVAAGTAARAAVQQEMQWSGAFLPAPTPPSERGFPSSGLVAAVVGEELAAPLVELEAAISAAEAAFTELEACRPAGLGRSGARFSQALADDAVEYAKGGRPKVWQAQALLDGDVSRWATAQAAVGAVPAARARCEARLDRANISSTADMVAEAKANLWVEAAAAGWESRRDQAEAWQHYRHGEELLSEYGDACGLSYWAAGVAPPEIDNRFPPMVDHLPDDASARGLWLCLELALEPSTRWLRLPIAVGWPEGGEVLFTRALGEDGTGFVGLREKGHVERTI